MLLSLYSIEIASKKKYDKKKLIWKMEEKANSIYEMVGVYQVDLIIQKFHEDHFLNVQTNVLLDGAHWSSCNCHISQ